MLQRQIMIKQLQELQRQHQLHELENARQQSYTSELPTSHKQNSGAQFPPLINGTVIHDASQMFTADNMTLVPRHTSPNYSVFSQAQRQNLHSMGPVTQQLDVSLYGTPLSSAGNNFSQYAPLQGESYDRANLFTKGNNGLADKPKTQSLAIMNSFMNNQCNASSGKVFQEKNLLGLVPIEGLSSGVLLGNFQQINTLVHRNASVQEYGRNQEKAVWPGLFPGKTTNLSPSEVLASLDPLEQKILFSMDDNGLETSFGQFSDRDFENTLENRDSMNALPSIQSGSWSALMQSAVAEASSSDTGPQEEWSGLSFQNPEHSTDNLPSNFVDSAKKQNNWDDNLQSASVLSLKPQVVFNDADISLKFHGFQQQGLQLSVQRREGLHSNSSLESIQKSPRSASKWSLRNPQQKQPFEGSRSVHTLSPLKNAGHGQVYEHLESDAHQPTMSSYANGSQPCINHTGAVNGSNDKDFDSARKIGHNHEALSFSDSVSGLEQVKSGKVNTVVDREHSQLNNFAFVQKSSTTKIDQRFDQESRLSGESCFQGENSNDSHHSHGSHHIITGHGGKDNVWVRRSDSQTVSVSNQKPFGQVIYQQFLQGLSSHEQGYARQFEFKDNMGNVSNNDMDIVKGRLPDSQRNSRASAYSDRSAGFSGSNVNVQTSENVLGLLNKIGMPRAHGTGVHFGSTDSISLTEVPQAETPDESPKSCNKSSASPYFGIGLISPSQRLPNLNFFDSSQSSPRKGNSIATFPFGRPNVRNQLQNQDLPTSPVVYQTPLPTLPDTAGKFMDFDNNSSWDTSPLINTNPYGRQFPISEAMQVTQPSVTFDSRFQFSPKPPNVWTNTHIQQHLSYTEPQKVSSRWLHSPDSANSSMETASGAPEELHDKNYLKGVNNSQEIDAHSTDSPGSNFGKEQPGNERSHQQISSGILVPASQSGISSHGQESSIMLLSELNSVASGSLMTGLFPQGLDQAHHSDNQATTISAKDLEDFGRYLRPSNAHHQNYSLLHQVNSAKNLETDPSKRVLVRNLANSELNVVSQLNQFPPGNNGMLSFSSGVKGDQLVQASPQTIFVDAPQEIIKVVQNDPQSPYISNNMASFKREPAWFKRYGSLKNGQVLQLYDTKAAKNAAHQFSLGEPLRNLQMKSSMVQVTHTATTSVAVNHLSPIYESPSDVTNRTLAVLRPKKRKVDAYELVPWHKEVSQRPQRLQSISKAEQEWAQAANRLVEKVDGEVKMIEDMLPRTRPKKRLTMTTQLMQQLFRPVPAVILSADATSNCVDMAYVAARLGLGDACSLTNDSHKPSDTYDMSSETVKTAEGIEDNNFAEILEDLINRERRLEDGLLRLDKGASILDVRVESQELERFSVINRFVKFHSRPVQDVTAETSSSGATSTAPEVYPQRYVTALPMPRTVPEGTRCLSL